MKRAVFLDRDGTLVREVNYLARIADLRLLPGVARALRRLGRRGYLRLVLSNQSGVARGLFSEAFVAETHRVLRRRLRARGADLEGFYVCPHHPEFTGPCRCRKPAPGLLLAAAAEWGVDLGRSWLIGDRLSDLEAGRAAGCQVILVRTGYGRETGADLGAADPTAVVDSLTEAVDRILETESR